MDLNSKIENVQMDDLDRMNEEFNNFMYKVTEVSEIVKKLTSNDKNLQEIGTLEADKFLKCNHQVELENVDENQIKLEFKTNKTVINKKALRQDDGDKETMSQEAFMEEVSKDADRRYKNKLIRKEKCETFKKQAMLAFRRGEYERALNCYIKAIEQIKDSPALYCNRALTYINLKLYDKAIDDCQTALRLNEDSLKAWLLSAKANYLLGRKKAYDHAIEEAKSRNADQTDFICEYVENLEKNKCEDN